MFDLWRGAMATQSPGRRGDGQTSDELHTTYSFACAGEFPGGPDHLQFYLTHKKDRNIIQILKIRPKRL